ncbi:uncharacterized protein JCM15063_000193 [Sporobolomyces koalae]|uniref:uncharacterized protein n=1 Tax=Sporobolomyces koalae TaxID=500713 RepID=UPI00316CE1CC
MGLFTSCWPGSAPSSTTSFAELLHEKDPEKGTTRLTVEAHDSTANLEHLRANVIPTADAHNSEYVGECDKRRAWISGFNGSAGTAIVTLTEAHLFTDSRYWTQAQNQIDSNWTLHKVGESDSVKNWDAWLLELPRDTRVGIDPSVLDYGTGKSLSDRLASKSIPLVFPPTANLVDEIWTSRPPRSHAEIELHPLKFTGLDARTKLSNLRTWLDANYAGQSERVSYLVTTLSPLAWLLNLRGHDIEFNPMFYGYALIEQERVTLWVQDQAVTPTLRTEIEERLGGTIAKYESVIDDLKQVEGKVVVDPKVNFEIIRALGEDRTILVKQSPIETAQAIKNPVEIQGLRNAYLRDGVAWTRWAAWLEQEMSLNRKTKKGSRITEWQAAEKLTEFRKQNEHFAGLAYDNISATGENAALPHYAPTASASLPIAYDSPYLNDSGAQYLDGTIDTTRTVHFGRPTREHRHAFTRVLQGHARVDRVVFPAGTTGAAIEVLAREPLWSEGMNYNHGTGHGVGSYLSVHEVQVGLSGTSLAYFNTPFVEGHVTSNEPAYYETGSYGIRIESVVGVREVQTRRQFGDKKWYGFERFTTVPIQTSMVDFSLLSKEEKRWLKEHNETCKEKLIPLLKHDKRAIKWLQRQ